MFHAVFLNTIRRTLLAFATSVLTGYASFLLLATLIIHPAHSAEAVAQGNPVHGKRLFILCMACHTIKEGDPNKVGPNLYGVTGSKAASKPGFVYSTALAKSGLIWTDDKLDAWLTQPAALVSGTKMIFAGLPKAQDRADVIAYLHSAAH